MKVELQRPPEIDIIVAKVTNKYVSTQARTGIHLTDTIYCLRKAYWNRTDSLTPTPDEILYFILGLGLQDVLLGGDNQSVAELNGIVISPDYWESGVLGELKTTRIGQKRLYAYDFPDGWIKQLMGYAKVLDVTQAFLLVIPIIKPDIISFVFTFAQQELDYNWGERVTRANMLKEAFDTNTVPIPSNQQWECGSCRYALRCNVIGR